MTVFTALAASAATVTRFRTAQAGTFTVIGPKDPTRFVAGHAARSSRAAQMTFRNGAENGPGAAAAATAARRAATKEGCRSVFLAPSSAIAPSTAAPAAVTREDGRGAASCKRAGPVAITAKGGRGGHLAASALQADRAAGGEGATPSTGSIHLGTAALRANAAAHGAKVARAKVLLATR